MDGSHGALAVMVFPRIVHEGDARIDRFVDDADRLGLRVDEPEVIAAEPDDGDVGAGAPKGPSGDGSG